MNRTHAFFLALCFSLTVSASPGQDYLNKFMAYMAWSQHLPSAKAEPAFLAFIDDTSPLAQKLRAKWLYQLAWNKDWVSFAEHYKESSDINLQCYAEYARYLQGPHGPLSKASEKLWLQGDSLPKACDELFSLLLKNKELDEKLITQRIILALEKRNVSLASYLLKQYHSPRLDDAKRLLAIHQNPTLISQLGTQELHGEFYLYGLKQLVSTNRKQALPLFELGKSKHIINHAQQQAFLVHVTIYKAMRNAPDTAEWFAKVEPDFYNDTLLGWQIRYALKNKEWQQVERLIHHIQDKDNPCWLYWQARALEAEGHQEQADAMYQNLAKLRHYYGFLASLRIKSHFSFENEQATSNMQILQPYQLITDQIKTLYFSKQTFAASRLLNDFVSELPKDDKSALLYWLSHDLQWHDKSVYLSSNNELANQLSLRFPLAYHNIIAANSKNYQIPKELVYAIIRQESSFRDDVVSTAGAHGLMQVLPSTALVVSKHERIAYTDKKQLFSSQKNINIGVAYLQQLAKRFDNHPILMIAAYNAGPKQVVYWMKNHPPQEIDIWIETLPWLETRNYLKNIISFYAIYQYRLREKQDLTPLMRELQPTEGV